MREWEEKETEKFEYLFPFLSNEDLSRVFNRSVMAIKHKAIRLNIDKSPYTFERVFRITETYHIYESKINFMV